MGLISEPLTMVRNEFGASNASGSSDQFVSILS
jgi:hypothetical protein